MKEVEITVSIEEDTAEKVLKSMRDIGEVKEIEERDIYYDHPTRDALENNECIRIRNRNGKPLEFTYKPPTTQEMSKNDQFWKEELDIDIEDEEEARTMKKVLHALGCERLVEVVKNRKKVKKGRQTIILDELEGSGHFIEIETLSTSEDVEDARRENRKMLSQLGVNKSQTVSQPYRDIVLKEGKSD